MNNQEMKRTINSNYSIEYSQASVDCNDMYTAIYLLNKTTDVFITSVLAPS